MNSIKKKAKIAIFGGGIARLTIDHECVEAGLEVDLYERHEHCGVKALGRRNDKGYHVEHA